MGKVLYSLEVFRKSIDKCAAALRPHGLDLVDIVVNGCEETYDIVTNTLPAITAVQIALVDTLTSLGIKPDFYFGHSLGELGCAYADDTLTAEETVLSAYWRGRSVVDSKLPRNSMAAIGESPF